MYRKLLFTFFLVIQFNLHGQNRELKTLLDSCMVNMEKYALNKSKVNWPSLKMQVEDAAKTMENPDDLKRIMSFLFEKLDDFHGQLIYKGKSFKWNPAPNNVSKEIQEQWNKNVGIKTAMFDDIAYLLVPFMLRQEREARVKELSDSLCKLLDRKPKGLILDLRINDGGDMHPMLLGLQQLLGNRMIMTYHYEDEPPNRIILNGDAIFHETDKILSNSPKCRFDATTLPVVLLQSAQTASSGENVLISFKGRHNTLTIGEDSAGYTTINTRFEFGPDVYLLLAVGYATDRNGTMHLGKIKPDLSIKSVDNFQDLTRDEKVLAAIKRLDKF